MDLFFRNAIKCIYANQSNNIPMINICVFLTRIVNIIYILKKKMNIQLISLKIYIIVNFSLKTSKLTSFFLGLDFIANTILSKNKP